MSEPVRRSPLGHRAPVSGPAGDRMAEAAFLGIIVLRVDPARAGDAMAGVVGAALPEACRATAAGDVSLLWIGPDETWVVTPPGAEAGLAARLEQALSGQRRQIVDVSDQYAAIELAGPNAREILMKVSTLDLHPRAFGPGHVAGSMFARVQATLWQVGDGPVFRLFVRRSMADYLWCLLARCGREFGLPDEVPLHGETWRLAR